MRTHNLLNWIFGIATILVVFGKAVTLLQEMYTVPHAGTDGFTGWLIDYSQGYVRRGLFGQIVRWFYEAWGIEPQWTIFIVAWLTFLSLTTIVFVLFRRRGLCWWPLMSTVCLGGLAPAYRDSLVLLLCMACYWSCARLRKPWPRYLIANLIAILLINVHEIGFFLTFPAMALLSMGDEEVALPTLLRPLVLAPAGAAFLLTWIFRGDGETAQGIIAGWQKILPPWWNGVDLKTIGVFIGGDPSTMAASTGDNMLSRWHGVPHFLLFLGEVLASLVVIVRLPLSNSKGTANSEILPLLAIGQLLPMAIVFPLFWDYSRLFGLWSVSTLMCFAIVPMTQWCKAIAALDAIGCGIGSRLKTCRLGISRYFDAFPTWLVVALALMVGMSGVRFDFNACLGRSVIGSFVHSFAWDVYKSHGDVGTWLRLQAR